MNHHERPFDISGPEFEGLTSDEAFDLKRQLRIRDRNRYIGRKLTAKQGRRSATRVLVGTIALVIMWAITVIALYVRSSP